MTIRQGVRPFVTANFAITWDGHISTRESTPSDFSSSKDKRGLLEIRATCDAVLASAKTVSADNMTMGLPDAGLRAQRKARGQSEYPLRVLLSNSGQIQPEWRIFTQKFSPMVIFSTTRMPENIQAALATQADVWLDDRSSVNLHGLMRTLHEDYGVRRLVCEGGGQIFRSLLSAGLVDELHLTLCPRIFGGVKAPTITGLVGSFLPKAISLKLREFRVVEHECFLRYRISARSTPSGKTVCPVDQPNPFNKCPSN